MKHQLRSRFDQTYERAIVDRFHKLYYDRGISLRTRWLGTPVQKLPLDLWLMQELIVELRPDLIVETGTAAGGSALFYATVMDVLDHGRIVSVDIDSDPAGRPIRESSTSAARPPTHRSSSSSAHGRQKPRPSS